MENLRSYEHGTPVWVDLETTIGTTDASRFYCGLFGWRVFARHRPIEDASGYWAFRQDGKLVGGLGPGKLPTWTVYMSVPDVEATTRVVVDNGGAVLVWPMTVPEAGRLAVFADPQGARFAIWQPAADPGADIMDEPNSFTWTELACPDIEAAKRFYNAVFGWETRSWPYGDGLTYTEYFHLGADKAIAGMVQTDQRRPEDAPPRWTIYFAVADADAIAARADELGGKVSVTPYDLPGVGRIAELNDPEGTVFAILQRA